MGDRKVRRERQAPTPGCSCTECSKRRARQEKSLAASLQNMGRVQHGAVERGWRDGGTDGSGDGKFGHLRSHEAADREEREAYGKPLVAAYRHLLGPTPQCLPADHTTAAVFLAKVEAAIEQGDWTRPEWGRLYRMRAKWRARASGNDPRFELVGTKPTGLDKQQTAAVQDRRIVRDMLAALRKSSNGD